MANTSTPVKCKFIKREDAWLKAKKSVKAAVVKTIDEEWLKSEATWAKRSHAAGGG